MRARRGRVLRTAAVAVACAVSILSASTACAPPLSPRSMKYCAHFPDAIGLYAGNPVTQMGYKVGTIEKITPTNTDVKVDFAVTKSRALPKDVKAIIRSTSILADRALELVGNYESGPRLKEGECIPLGRTSTPKSLSEVIGSTAEFFNSMTPDGSKNLADTLKGVDQLTHDNGIGIKELLTRSSELLDNPDRVISDFRAIASNLKVLTGTVEEVRAPLKSIIQDTALTMADVSNSLDDAERLDAPVWMVIQLVEDLELRLGDFTQLTLDAVTVAIRKLAPHANFLAHLFDIVPWWTNWFANHANNHRFNFLQYRPPMWRIRTPDGWALCGFMNTNSPGSCANVGGQPYAADVSLLQYVFMKAASR